MVNYKKLNKNKGFTLIEVLVSSSILALLAAIIFANVHQGRIKAAEIKALQEARTLQVSAELYRSDYGKYPISKGTKEDLPNLENQLVPEYIPEVPHEVNVGEYENFCPNIPKIIFISDGDIAVDDNFEYRCGFGSVPDAAVILILDKRQNSHEDISLEFQPYARFKGSSDPFDQFILAVYTPPFDPEPQCAHTMIGSGLIDSAGYGYRCLAL